MRVRVRACICVWGGGMLSIRVHVCRRSRRKRTSVQFRVNQLLFHVLPCCHILHLANTSEVLDVEHKLSALGALSLGSADSL
jgi:hypothetical protein